MSQKKGSKGYNPVSAAAAKKKREQMVHKVKKAALGGTPDGRISWR